MQTQNFMSFFQMFSQTDKYLNFIYLFIMDSI